MQFSRMRLDLKRSQITVGASLCAEMHNIWSVAMSGQAFCVVKLLLVSYLTFKRDSLPRGGRHGPRKSSVEWLRVFVSRGGCVAETT